MQEPRPGAGTLGPLAGSGSRLLCSVSLLELVWRTEWGAEPGASGQGAHRGV